MNRNIREIEEVRRLEAKLRRSKTEKDVVPDSWEAGVESDRDVGAGASTRDDAERRLLLYMIGWRKGVTAAAVTEANLANDDFRAGHEEGRAAKRTAHGAACLIYGTTLNPLRGGRDDDEA